MKRILVCGSNGLLGQQVAWKLSRMQGFEVLHTSRHRSFVLGNIPLDYTQLDIAHRQDVKSLVSSYRPDIIINAAAMTNVDQCEIEKESAWKNNVTAVENLVEISRRIGAHLVHVSTDYVFDGLHGPYAESDRTNPINYYGKTKLAGENTIIGSGIRSTILRTILVYGTGNNIKNNFVLWVINSLRGGQTIRCVSDQTANPTHVSNLADAVITASEIEAEGVYHICGSEAITRYDFACRIAEIFELDATRIQKTTSDHIRTIAARPLLTGFRLDKAIKTLNFSPLSILEGLLLLKKEMGVIARN